jgi:FkbH-like protein
MRLILSSTSFLLPKNKFWNLLEKDFQIEFADYGNWSGSLINTDANDALSTILFLDDVLDLKNNSENDIKSFLQSFLDLLLIRLSKSKAPTFVFFLYCKDDHLFIKAKKITSNAKINQWFMGKLEDIAAKFQYFYFLDTEKIFSFAGINNCLDERNWYFARCRLSAKGIEQIANILKRILDRYKSAPSKMLILDCDNTIWGGVIGEDGIKNILLGQDGLGQAYVDFQIYLKKLSKEGVLLALASKNNEFEVWNVFEKHNLMVLKKEDIVSYKLNWNEKFQSIKEISDEINIGLDSMVFWDDNPVERDKVRKILPEVNTLEVPEDVFLWPKYLENLDFFVKLDVTKDDLLKTKQYRARAEFLKEKNAVFDEYSYLKSINLRASIINLNDSNISRASQLCLKTNQFNLRTIRHSSEELIELKKKNSDFVFLTELSDKYGDHGIVGLVCITEINTEIAFLETFLLSCRVIGRHLETWMLSQSLNRAKKHGYKYLVGEFIASERNNIAKNFFLNHGFHLIKDYKKNLVFEKKLNDNFYILQIDKTNFNILNIYENN